MKRTRCSRHKVKGNCHISVGIFFALVEKSLASVFSSRVIFK